MRWYSKAFFAVTAFVFFSAALFAQNNICQASMPSVPDTSRAELARIQVEERARLEMARANWTATIVPLKNAVSSETLKVLCIFGIEVAPQPAQRLVAIRAPKELMTAVEDAIKRLDVASPVARSVDLTGYVLVVSEVVDPTLMPVPAALQPVVTQLKSLLPNGNVYLADTIVTRGTAGNVVSVQGESMMNATIQVREGTPSVVRLDNFIVRTNNASFNTSVDVPVGAQVVVGKATSNDSKKRAVILVMTAKLLE